MPKRTDIKKILIIGSGPIVIGQACEFDYSGTQACKALKEEGFEIVLVNSNPATIMTDPEIADRTYIEPLTPDFIQKIIEKEKVDAVLPTLGGQTALNVVIQLYENGVLEKHGVKLIGAQYEAIKKAEDREQFKKAMVSIGLDIPKSYFAYSLSEAKQAVSNIGFPVIIRPSFTLGGKGGGIANDMEEFEKVASLGIESSMINEILIEESITGWKEYEFEVMRDYKDNVVIVCSIENLDPMGIHTGDSITVAPAQTLSDKEYQAMRDASIAIMREIGVETGGSNVQFAVNPQDGRMVVIEMNPRVSRSSALASKATGFPIAKLAAKLAIGYSLDELPNDITQKTPACFEPTIDYCVIKIPRFTFEKFPEATDILGISMKSVGETMAIGRTFKESLQKSLGGLEIGHSGFDNKLDFRKVPVATIEKKLSEPNASRIFYIKYALQKGMSISQIFSLTKIDPWFIHNMQEIVNSEKILNKNLSGIDLKSNLTEKDILLLTESKKMGFSDKQLSLIMKTTEQKVRALRKKYNIIPVFKLVDTCAAEFEAYTPYYYSTYEQEEELIVSDKEKVIILGGGPNRIGQGIEFDYCCCHASFSLKELGYETIMVNSNPETVSTDYDTSDKLYFEPLTFEHVMNIIDKEKPKGVIIQLGGQTPLNLARSLRDAGVPILGTSVDSIDLSENRERFSEFIKGIGLSQPPNGSAFSPEEAMKISSKIGYPVVVRPSYVIGGRAMRIVYNEESLLNFVNVAKEVSVDSPILIDKFIEDAIEVDVDAISDGSQTHIAGIMEHIENAGIHSGDSACVLPPHTLSEDIIEKIKEYTIRISSGLKVIGLINIQFAIKGDNILVLEVNPRASRTVPFVSKATGIPYAKIASQLMVGKKLADFSLKGSKIMDYFAVKESVLPFCRFSGVDIVLGPEMKSTGEVMGIDSSFGAAFFKSQMSAGQSLPNKGLVFLSVANKEKRNVIFLAKKLIELGFSIISTKGTHKVLKSNDVSALLIDKINEGENMILDLIKKEELKLVINVPSGEESQIDMKTIRATAVLHNIPCITTLQGAVAAVNGMDLSLKQDISVKSLQEYYC